jgi:alkanesulfonate monooxygenase SsuD/methylene tetrahydromethanopterin reductase-like flavin-dependent oxidoreductase (luciferase family)
MMTGCVFGKEETLDEKMKAYGAESLEELQEHGMIAGDADTVREQLKQLEEAGLQRIMLQWLAQDDLEGLELLAKAVL